MLSPIFKKLNLKEQKEILVLNAPDSFKSEIRTLGKDIKVFESINSISKIEFGIVFVTKQVEIDESIKKISPKISGDAILWYCYPKASSKKYQCDFNRDKGWYSIGEAGLEPVRQVAIDEDWSALRFRRVEFIKNITRRESFAITTEAKKRTTKKGE